MNGTETQMIFLTFFNSSSSNRKFHVKLLKVDANYFKFIVKEQLLEFIGDNDILIQNQSGFRKKLLLNLVLNYWKYITETIIIMLFFLTSKEHLKLLMKILLSKLKYYGIQNRIKLVCKLFK